MKCKNCGERVEPAMTRCPNCGSRLPENPGDSENTSGKSKRWTLILVAALVAVAIVAGIIWAVNRDPVDPDATEPSTSQDGTVPSVDATDATRGEPTAEDLAAYPVLGRDNYTSEGNSAQDMSAVAVTMGDVELTNGQLSVWYWQNYYDLQSQLGYYISAYGLDTTKPLEEQDCPVAAAPMTWQQFLLENALSNWQSYMAMVQEAKAAGMTLSQENQEALDNMEQTMEETAAQYSYPDALTMIQSDFGAGVTMADYKAFVEILMLGNQYYEEKAQELAPTSQEVSDYYDENSANFILQGVEKVDMPSTVDVRHILIQPEGTAEGEDNSYTEEQMAAARSQAQAILDQWKAGDATQESFAALATEKTQDPGSKDSGGLYEGVYPGQMVPEFNDWCFDTARKAGDTALVETSYGVHIMYFVSASEDIYWYAQAEAALLQEILATVVEDAIAAHPYEVDYQKVYLSEVSYQATEY